ncbi:MAG: hypothetical protein AAFY41_06205 [Bacteroidota bacterium]
MKIKNPIFLLSLLLSLAVIVSCSDDDGASMDDDDDNEEEETITEVILTFTPDDGGDDVTARWFDADGDGAGDPTIETIELIEGVEYDLSITLTNTLEDPDEDKTAEILSEDDEHMFFFGFTAGTFADPTGNGNVDNRSDDINYNDQDENGLPVGLSTTWTAGEHTEATGEFNVVLKHQPGEKSATSDISIGGTDLDIDFPIDIVEDPNAEEEVINQIVLTFTPDGGGTAVTATWFDADGDGAGNPVIDDINLTANTTYEMSMTL